AAYVFNRDSAGVWVETQKLHGLDRSWDRFGSSVSISGNKALIGAYAKSDTSIYSHGAAYLFERDASGTWAEAQKLEAPDKQQYAYYGISVSISGANAIVGAERTSDGGTSRNGSAYFYGDDADWELPALVTSCNASNLPAPTATDNCAGSITAVPLGNTSFSGPGQHFVTWVFDDGNGNITNQVQEINISSSISTRMQAMPANVCPGGKVDLTSLLRDYSMSIRQVAFYDDDPAQGGQQVGTCRMFRGQARPGSNVMVQPAYTHTYWAVFDGAGSCSEYLPIPVTVKTNCVIYPTVIAKLEGAYNPSSGNMRTGLNSANLIPVQEPYTGLGYTFTGGGGESMTIAAQNNSNVVDWVIVELRDTANSATVVHSRAALLLSNGYIVDVDGINPPQMSVNANQPYYVAVIHRNHLGVMTSAPIYPWQVADFSSPNMSVYGGQNARVIQQGAALMGAGDADGNGQVQNTDDILEWMPSAGTSGYKSGDYNLDGQVQNSERVSFWMQNTGRGSAVPK
ncbi:MAG: FG-GAP repeat protein, partial [Bacteroidia bacterium]